MTKIIDYDILHSCERDKLIDIVKDKIKNGFQPYGFMKIKGDYQYTEFYQTIVKYE